MSRGMMIEKKLMRAGTTIASVWGDGSEDRDFTRLHEILITEFRRLFPNEFFIDTY